MDLPLPHVSQIVLCLEMSTAAEWHQTIWSFGINGPIHSERYALALALARVRRVSRLDVVLDLQTTLVKKQFGLIYCLSTLLLRLNWDKTQGSCR